MKNSDKCGGPCISEVSWFYNVSAHLDPTLWNRNQRATVVWTRNGHRYGFIRLTLVPIEKRMSFSAHAKYTFHYACFESNPSNCDPDEFNCGTDDIIYTTEFKVPKVPDGDYVLGWSWYGAAAQTNNEVWYNFGDYWSCSFIRIQGGASESRKDFVPIFKSGTGEPRCNALTNQLHVCQIEPCKDAFDGKPALEYYCPYTMRWDGNSCRTPSDAKIEEQDADDDDKKEKDEKNESEEKEDNREDKEKDEKKDNDVEEDEEDRENNADEKEHKEKENNEKEDKEKAEEKDEKKKEKNKKQKKSVCSCPVRGGKGPQVTALMLVELEENKRLKRGATPRCLCTGRRSQVYITRKEREYGLAIIAFSGTKCRDIALLLKKKERKQRCHISKHTSDYGAVLGRFKPKLNREIYLKARADGGSKFSARVTFKRAKE